MNITNPFNTGSNTVNAASPELEKGVDRTIFDTRIITVLEAIAKVRNLANYRAYNQSTQPSTVGRVAMAPELQQTEVQAGAKPTPTPPSEAKMPTDVVTLHPEINPLFPEPGDQYVSTARQNVAKAYEDEAA